MLGVFGCEMEVRSWGILNPRLSAVQLRGPRPQYFAVVKEKSQNWYSHVDVILWEMSPTSEIQYVHGEILPSLCIVHRPNEIVKSALCKEISSVNSCFLLQSH